MPKFEFPKNYKFSSDDSPKQKKEDDPRFFYPGQLDDKESVTLRHCGDFNTVHRSKTSAAEALIGVHQTRLALRKK